MWEDISVAVGKYDILHKETKAARLDGGPFRIDCLLFKSMPCPVPKTLLSLLLPPISLSPLSHLEIKTSKYLLA